MLGLPMLRHLVSTMVGGGTASYGLRSYTRYVQIARDILSVIRL